MINSLGIKKTPKDTKVVVAMSGGVDSSVVAALMKEAGNKGGEVIAQGSIKEISQNQNSKIGRAHV